MPKFLMDGVEELIKALKLWTSKKDELVKYHKLQIPIEINALCLIKSLERELKENSKLASGSDFPTGKLPSPAIVSTASSSKTVIRLKLPPKEDLSDSDDKVVSDVKSKSPKAQKKKEKAKKKEKKTKKIDLDDSKHEEYLESSRIKTVGKLKEKRKRGRPRKDGPNDDSSIDTKLPKSKASYKSDIGLVRLNVSEHKLSLHSTNKYSLEEHGLPQTSQSDKSDETSIRLKLLFPPLTSPCHPPIPTSSIVTNRIDSNTSLEEVKEDSTNSFETKPRLDIKAEIEAAKKDLFHDDSTKDNSGKLFLKPENTENDFTGKPVTFNLNRNFPSKLNDENIDNIKIDTSPEKVKENPIPMPNSHSGSDYDPSDDAYYEDADFVYPRIDVTSEISDEDFSWRPGQRKKNKIPEKRRGSLLSASSTTSMSTDGFDPFFAPDDHDVHRQDSDELKDIIRPPQSKTLKDKEKPKKGFSTAKQRLGKLLKLDKTGSRFVR